MTSFHIDDEALSAAVDAEATAEEQAHLDSCSACREKVDRLRATAQAVGAAVTPRPAAEIDAAIQAAITVAYEVARGGADEPMQASGTDRASAGGTLLAWPGRRILAAAAVIVALLGVGGLMRAVLRGQSSSRVTSVASRPVAPAPSSATKGLAGASPGGATVAGPVPPGAMSVQDLGAQSDPAALARLVDGQLAARAAVTAPGLGSAAGPATTQPAPRAPAPAQPSCAGPAAIALGLGGQRAVLVYVAPVTWRGQQGVVLVYNKPSGGRAGVVMAAANCTPLAGLPV